MGLEIYSDKSTTSFLFELGFLCDIWCFNTSDGRLKLNSYIALSFVEQYF